MDGQRFDQMTRAMASGSTRRRALRLAGGGLAGALLAAAGLGRRASAQGPEGEKPLFTNCNPGSGGVIFHGLDENVLGGDSLPCGGNEDCPQDRVCASAVNPGNRVVCRCVTPI